MNKETYKDVFRKKLNETRRNFGDVDVWDTPGEAPVRNPKPVKPRNPTRPSEPNLLFPFGKPILQPSYVDPIRPLPPLQKPSIKPTKPTEV